MKLERGKKKEGKIRSREREAGEGCKAERKQKRREDEQNE